MGAVRVVAPLQCDTTGAAGLPGQSRSGSRLAALCPLETRLRPLPLPACGSSLRFAGMPAACHAGSVAPEHTLGFVKRSRTLCLLTSGAFFCSNLGSWVQPTQ